MRLSTFIVCLMVIATVGCAGVRQEPISSRHLTEAQVIEIAKPALPLSVGQSYFVRYNEEKGVWAVSTKPDKSPYNPKVIVIRDSDSKVLLFLGEHF
jgi:hypothetical protein